MIKIGRLRIFCSKSMYDAIMLSLSENTIDLEELNIDKKDFVEKIRIK